MLNRISSLLSAAWRVYRIFGLSTFLAKLKAKIKRADKTTLKTIVKQLMKNDVIGFYRFVLARDGGRTSSNTNRKSLLWIIPHFGIGSGGHLNIFRFVYHLEREGYECHIAIDGPHDQKSPSKARDIIREHFFPVNAQVYFGVDEVPHVEAVIATSWITAYTARAFSRARRKIYFVQDFEPFFYAHGSEYEFAENTYRLGFDGFVAGDWLKDKLSRDYGMRCESFSFSYDKDMYIPQTRREPEILRVFCYARPPTTRRGFETAMLALSLVGDRVPRAKFIFAGWDMSGYEFPHEHLNAGVLSLAELPDLYSQCDVALVLSFTNVSLLPLELMACGCAVVSNRGPHTEWLLNDSCAKLCDSDPVSVADAIVELLEDPGKRKALIEQGLSFSKATHWEMEAKKLSAFLSESKA